MFDSHYRGKNPVMFTIYYRDYGIYFKNYIKENGKYIPCLGSYDGKPVYDFILKRKHKAGFYKFTNGYVLLGINSNSLVVGLLISPSGVTYLPCSRSGGDLTKSLGGVKSIPSYLLKNDYTKVMTELNQTTVNLLEPIICKNAAKVLQKDLKESLEWNADYKEDGLHMRRYEYQLDMTDEEVFADYDDLKAIIAILKKRAIYGNR